jgi:thymidylate synthase
MSVNRNKNSEKITIPLEPPNMKFFFERRKVHSSLNSLKPIQQIKTIKEIFWIYQKQTSSLKIARELGINWWDEWNIGDDTIGQRYGATIKRYDLMNKLIDGLVNDPFSRRHIIDMYQYSDLEKTKGLYPCAYKTSWSVRKIKDEYYLDLTLDQRSNDYIMAGYINKIQYS